MRQRTLWCCALFISGALTTEPALACEPGLCAQLKMMSPAPDSVGVPTTARLRVPFDIAGTDPDWSLVLFDGEDVATSAQVEAELSVHQGGRRFTDVETGWWELKPKAPLKPEHTYTMQLSSDNVCGPSTITMRFTTGAQAQDPAPAPFKGAINATYRAAAPSVGDCGGGLDRLIITVNRDPSSDPASFYYLQAGPERVDGTTGDLMMTLLIEEITDPEQPICVTPLSANLDGQITTSEPLCIIPSQVLPKPPAMMPDMGVAQDMSDGADMSAADMAPLADMGQAADQGAPPSPSQAADTSQGCGCAQAHAAPEPRAGAVWLLALPGLYLYRRGKGRRLKRHQG